MSSKRKKIEEEHDPKICFRCRLYDLWEELKGTNKPRFILMCMAEACASILSQLDEADKLLFMLAVTRMIEEDENEYKNHTKH